MSTKTVTMSINVPEGVIHFLNNIIPSTDYENVKDYLEDAIIDRLQADVENDIFAPKLKNIINRYNLKGVFNS